MKKLILHIGCEKTGTTSIQNFLFENRKALLRDHGIYFPTSLGMKNHTRLAIYACDEGKNLKRFLPKGRGLDSERREIEREFLQEIEECGADTVLISNEWLHPRVRSNEEFARLKSLFSRLFDEVNVVLYLRRQDKLALSLYSTSLKAGNYEKFAFPEIKAGMPLPYYYDFHSIYRNWTCAFGRGNVKLRIFNREALVGGDVNQDFISYLNIQGEGYTFLKEDNLSLSNTGVRLMRLFNRLIVPFAHDIKPKKLRKMRALISSCFKGRPTLATTKESEEFFRKFEQSNAKLAESYREDCGELIAIN